MQRIRGVKRGTFYFITVLEIAFCCLLDAGNCRVFGVALRHPMGGSSECRNRSGGLHERVPWNSAATRQGDPKQKMLFVTDPKRFHEVARMPSGLGGRRRLLWHLPPLFLLCGPPCLTPRLPLHALLCKPLLLFMLLLPMQSEACHWIQHHAQGTSEWK
jgi:hypothetical protein